MAYAHRTKNTFAALPFISTWRTSTVYTGSTANNQIKLPLEVAGTYKFTVDWGDSTSSVITTWDQAETLHTYPAPGDYTVTITGFIKGWDWGGGGPVAPTTGDMRKLLTITQFGCLRFVDKNDTVNIWGAFYGCTNLNLTGVQDMPNFKGTTSTLGFLRLCSAITTVNNINKWDVSRIQIFRNTFREMLLFNDNIGNWNTGKGVDFTAMFLSSNTSGVSGIFNNGGSDSIKNWDTSSATNMFAMFAAQRLFNQEIGLWDVSNVTSMASMFLLTGVGGVFNNGGSDSMKNWNTSKVTTMRTMFQNQTSFNQEVGLWDVGNVTDFTFFVSLASPRIGVFNNNGSDSIKNWNTSKVTSTRSMFQNQPLFNQNVGLWDISNVTDTSVMFGTSSVGSGGAFNNGGSDSIKNWNTSNVLNMANMFQNQTVFNQEIGLWDVSNVTSISNILGTGATTAALLGIFNNAGSPSINNWNTSNVTNMTNVFTGQRFFNQPIGNWDTSKVTNMNSMFYASNVSGFPGAFNQDIGTWNTSNVTNMSQMFVHQINFNQDIGNWNVSKVTNFSSFITGLPNSATTIFNNGGNPSINNWNTGLVTNMNGMFRFGIGFNQPIGNWNISLVTDFGNFMQNKTFNDYSTANYDALLIGWASRPVQANRSINFNTIKYTAAAVAARAILTSAPNNWTIVDGGI